MKELDELIQAIIKSLKTGDDLDKDYIFLRETIFTKRDLMRELQSRSEIGMEIVKDVMLLSLDLLSKGKKVV